MALPHLLRLLRRLYLSGRMNRMYRLIPLDPGVRLPLSDLLLQLHLLILLLRSGRTHRLNLLRRLILWDQVSLLPLLFPWARTHQ